MLSAVSLRRASAQTESAARTTTEREPAQKATDVDTLTRDVGTQTVPAAPASMPLTATSASQAQTSASLPPTPSQRLANHARAKAAPLVQRFLADNSTHTCLSLVADMAQLTGKALGAHNDQVFADVLGFLAHCFDVGDLQGAQDCLRILSTACTERGKVGSPHAAQANALLEEHVYPQLEAALRALDFAQAKPLLALFDAAAGDRDKKYVSAELVTIDKLVGVLRTHVWTSLHALMTQPHITQADLAAVQEPLELLVGAGEAGRAFSDELLGMLVNLLDGDANLQGDSIDDRLARSITDTLGGMWLSRTDSPRPIVLTYPVTGSPTHSVSVRRDDYALGKPEVIVHTPRTQFVL